MVEKQNINGRDVWLKVDPVPVERENANIIPREYFTARYYFKEPDTDIHNGEAVRDENGEEKRFESPVAALSYAWRQIRETDPATGGK